MTDRHDPLSIEAFTRLYRKPLHPSVANGREVIEDEDRERGGEFELVGTQVRRELNRLWRAVMLAPDLETCESLLAGDQVPLSRLDPVWLARFKRR